jgi:hypothetical protein
MLRAALRPGGDPWLLEQPDIPTPTTATRVAAAVKALIARRR